MNPTCVSHSRHPQRRLIPQLSVRLLVLCLVMLAALGSASGTTAHKHSVTTGNGDEQYIANEQNHPGFSDPDANGLRTSCEGVNEPEDMGPAWYGLETAHHGPDQGTPGKGEKGEDGCYGTYGVPLQDENPAID